MLRRIRTNRFYANTFWLRKRGGRYVAYRSLLHALWDAVSPSIMRGAGQTALARAYRERRLVLAESGRSI